MSEMSDFVGLPADSSDDARRFGSLERALGAPVMQNLQNAHVVVAGIGGVGSWTAEALARSAVGELTLIDLDHVAVSNINRQVHALDETVGMAKVQAMAARIAQINPACRINAIDEFVEPDNVQSLIPTNAQAVIDCTDQMAAKVALVLLARERGQPLLVCGAAGGKTDPLTLQQGDLARATHDRLLARLRQQLRKHHGFARADAKRIPPMHVQALWLSQPALTPADGVGLAGSPLACAGYGSLVTVTASMGLAAAAWGLERAAATVDG